MWEDWQYLLDIMDFHFRAPLHQDEIDIITTFFPESIISGSTFTISSIIDTAIKTCIEVLIKSNEFIYIHCLNNCGDITGTNLLTLMDILATRLPNIQFILLDDTSKIYICGKVISLSTIKILTNGISWYNSHGYLSQNYDEEVQHNRKKINMQYSEFKDQVYELYIEQFKNENSLEKLTQLQKQMKDIIDKAKKKQSESSRDVSDKDKARLEQKIVKYDENQKHIDNYTTFISDKETEYKKLIDTQIFPDIDINSNVKEYFKKILSKMKTNTPDDCIDTTIIEQCDWLSKFISIIKKSKILQYDNKLKKIIRQKTQPPPSQPLTPYDLLDRSSLAGPISKHRRVTANVREEKKAKLVGGMTNRKKNIKKRYYSQKKYRRLNKTKHYKRQIKRYTKKYGRF
jgi:hypothetical protein